MYTGIFSGWVKTLADGTKILGCDSDVDSGQISWRKSQLDGMIGASVCEYAKEGPISANIFGTGPFWQSDDLIAPMCFNATVKGTRTARRVEKQILPTDRFIYVLQRPGVLNVYIEQLETKSCEEHVYSRINIVPEQIGQWVVAEIDLTNNQMKWYISKAMI